MTTHRRPAHHYGTGSAAVVLGAFIAACAVFTLAAVLIAAQRTAGPVTGAPVPEVLRPPAASVQITVKPDAAAMRAVAHAGHLRHLAAVSERHRDHLEHLAEEAGDDLT